MVRTILGEAPALRKAAGGLSEQFQEKCEAVFRPEVRENKEIEHFSVSVKG